MWFRREGTGLGDVTTPLVIGDPVTMNSSDQRWAEEADKRELEALPSIRGLAEKWAASLSGALGVVGLAALIEGADTFDRLDEPWRAIGQCGFVLAAVLALVATALAVLAAQGTAKRTFVPGGSALRDYAESAVDKALKLLAVSRWLAVGAVFSVIVAAGCLWFGAEKPGEPTTIEVHGSGELCAPAAHVGATSGDADIVVRCVP
jgi:hypothetical protein